MAPTIPSKTAAETAANRLLRKPIPIGPSRCSFVDFVAGPVLSATEERTLSPQPPRSAFGWPTAGRRRQPSQRRAQPARPTVPPAPHHPPHPRGHRRPPARLPPLPAGGGRPQDADDLLRAAGGDGRGQRGQGAQGPLLP